MAEAQITITDSELRARRTMNTANLKKHGAMYGLAVIASLTLFGAAHTWASATGWALATGTGIAAAIGRRIFDVQQ